MCINLVLCATPQLLQQLKQQQEQQQQPVVICRIPPLLRTPYGASAS
jgi:protein required for attachment to host cells